MTGQWVIQCRDCHKERILAVVPVADPEQTKIQTVFIDPKAKQQHICTTFLLYVMQEVEGK